MRLNFGILAFAAMATSAGPAAAQVIVYDNVTNALLNPLVNFAPNGGAANVAGNNITRLVADDCHLSPSVAGLQVSSFTWYVLNNNSSTVSTRMRLRFWAADGPGGLPGTLLNANTNTFPFSFAANTGVFFSQNSPGTFIIPANGIIWAGIAFDDFNGSSGATLAQLNNMGMAMFDPPSVGTSTDNVFTTTAAGAFNVNTPAGALNNFGGSPVANLDWQFSVAAVPEPSSLVLAGLAATGVVMRLRRRNIARVRTDQAGCLAV